MAPHKPITVSYGEGEALEVDMHEGGRIVLRKLDRDYDPTDRGRAFVHPAARETRRVRHGPHLLRCIGP